MIFIVFVSGVVCWTIAEYFMHRFLGHMMHGKNFFKSEHLTHHAKANYFAPAYKKAILAFSVSSALWFLLSVIFHPIPALAFVLGFTGMYTLYEVTHARFHRKGPIAMPFIVMRKHHFYHHFHNPKLNFGVTTRFWDRVFGTYQSVEQVRVPYKMSMQWLMDGEELQERYKVHFRLVGHG